MNGQEALDKAKKMLCDMAIMADGDPSSLSHSEFVMGMWNAFNKGREYGVFVSKIKREVDNEQRIRDQGCAIQAGNTIPSLDG